MISFFLVQWLSTSIAVFLMAQIVPGIRIGQFPTALLAALTIGIVNAVVWPLLVYLTLPLTILTYGLFLLVINGIALKLSSMITPGFEIDGLGSAILGSIVLSLIGGLIKVAFFPDQAG